MSGWWWNTRLNDAVERVGSAHRDTLLLWYVLMREVAAETRVWGEFSTSVEHWARRYGADVPTKGGNYYTSWRSIQEQFWQALVDAGVVELDGDMASGARVRVRVMDMVEEGRPSAREALLVPSLPQWVSPVLRATSDASLRASRSKHQRALREGVRCIDPVACLVCEGEAQPAQLAAVAREPIATECNYDGFAGNDDISEGRNPAQVAPVALGCAADIHASAPPHTRAPDYSEQSSSSPNGVPNNNPKSDARDATPTNPVVDLPPGPRTVTGQIRAAQRDLGSHVASAIARMIARRNGTRDSLLSVDDELSDYWKPACDLLAEFGAQRLRDAVNTAGDAPIRIGYLRSILRTNEAALAMAAVDNPDLAQSDWAGYTGTTAIAPDPSEAA
jgi:hypothetical protein